MYEAEHIVCGGFSRQHTRDAEKPENLPDGVEHEEEYDRQECLMIGKAVADGDWRVKVQTSGQQ